MTRTLSPRTKRVTKVAVTEGWLRTLALGTLTTARRSDVADSCAATRS